MAKREPKDIVPKIKMLNGTGLLFTADGKRFVSAVDYKFRAKTFGEVPEWKGTISVLNEIPMEVEYVLELEQDDERTGKIRLEEVKQKHHKGVDSYAYTFRGVTPLK